MSEYNAQLQTAAQLITQAAKASLLKKAVLSRHTAGDAIKTTLTLRSIGGRPCLQAESLHTDNKAKHRQRRTDFIHFYICKCNFDII